MKCVSDLRSQLTFNTHKNDKDNYFQNKDNKKSHTAKGLKGYT